MFKKSKILTASISVYPYTEEDLNAIPHLTDNDEYDNVLFIFSLTLSNTVGVAETKINFVKENGKYNLDSVSTTGDETQFEVFIQKTGLKCELATIRTHNGIEVSKNVVPVTYEMLQDYAECEDETDLDCDTLDEIYDNHEDEEAFEDCFSEDEDLLDI